MFSDNSLTLSIQSVLNLNLPHFLASFDHFVVFFANGELLSTKANKKKRVVDSL